MARRLDHNKLNKSAIIAREKRPRFYEIKNINYTFASKKQKSWCENILGIQIDKLTQDQAKEIIDAHLLSRSGGKRIDQDLYKRILREEYLER